MDQLYDRCGQTGVSDGLNVDMTDIIPINSIGKGISGDWRAIMSRNESDLFDERVRNEWLGTGLESLWEREMEWK